MFWEKASLFCRSCAFHLVVALDVVTFVAAVVVDVVLVIRFYVVCVIADIAVVLPDVSGFLLEAVHAFFDVFGTLLHVAGVVGSSVSADVVAVRYFGCC